MAGKEGVVRGLALRCCCQALTFCIAVKYPCLLQCVVALIVVVVLWQRLILAALRGLDSSHSLPRLHVHSFLAHVSFILFFQAELASDMHAGLSAAERRELAQLQPALEGLTKELAAARKARNQVRIAARWLEVCSSQGRGVVFAKCFASLPADALSWFGLYYLSMVVAMYRVECCLLPYSLTIPTRPSWCGSYLSKVPGPHCNLCSLFVSLLLCHTPQAQSQVTKLQTRLDTNLLKRLEQLQAAAAQPELAGQRASLAALSADLARAESALADVEGRLAAVEARSEELSKEVRVVSCIVKEFAC